MKMIHTIWLLLLTTGVFSQSQFISANKNEVVLNSADPATLACQLIAGCATEKEKVKAIFHWITDNIAYFRPDMKTIRKKNKIVSLPAEEPDDSMPLPSLTDRVANKVLKDRKAVCEGYARLFKSLCDYACIPSAIITGYARTDMNRSETKFRSNHSWNAVYFDSTWHLLDATWASGYVAMPSGEFVRYYDSYYFLTPPEQFIRHHYPDDLHWTLLADPPALSEFRTTPFRQRSFNKYYITSYSPTAGIIEASVGDTVHLAIEMAPGRYNGSISPDSLWDPASLSHEPMYAYVKPDIPVNSDKIVYSFPVDSENVQWLYVMYNDDAILRYKLNIRKAKN
jgi:Transglutaminase-like superfamily